MVMKVKIKICILFLMASALGILLCITLLGKTCAAAEETVFDIDAQMLPSSDMTYNIRLTVGNQGADWEGTVRLRMEDSYDSRGCVYDTVLSLPQGSTKQFVVRIPMDSMEYTGGTVKVSLLDHKSHVAAEKLFKRLLLDGADALSMGILSDTYQSLTYLDMGGEGLYYGGTEMPVKLLELDQDSLAGSLDSLIFLVIDNYNTSILTDETIDRIRQWVYDGGLLIVGTGKRAEDTLGGLEYLGIECIRVDEPGESSYGWDSYADSFTGFSQLPLAELRDTTGQYFMDMDSLILVSSQGYGAVEVVPYALSDVGQIDLEAENLNYPVWSLLQNVNGYTRIQHGAGNQGYFDNSYILRRIFRTLGNGGNRLNFGALKWIVVLYVIFVGPVLYLILRAAKKRDLYWIAVPVTTLAGILLVYFAGRGFEVVNTRVYSVTVEKLSGQSTEAVTYMHCYDAGHREWGLRLADRFEYTGPILESYYYGSYGSDDDAYRSYILKEGDRLSFGRNPKAGFEDCYFIAGTSRKLGTGSILCDLKPSAQGGVTGTVTNDTGRDFERFVVVCDNVLYAYGELPAGETCALEAEYTSGGQSYYAGYDSAMEAYLQDYMRDYYNRKEKEDIDIIAALGTGVMTACTIEGSDATVIIGVTKNWDKAVDDDCTEISYGCLYAVQ